MKLIYRTVHFIYSGITILLGYFVWSLKLSRIHTIRVIDDESFKFLHYGDIARILFAYKNLVSANKGFEYATLKIFKSLIQEKSTVLDIGANIGLFSLVASKKIGKNGKIYAFEPIKKTFKTLSENLALNQISNVVASQIALSNFTGKVSFSIPDDIHNKGDGDAFNSMDLNAKSSNSDTEADCSTLDDFLKANEISSVDLIKIDIEGAEMLCFEGAKNLLSSANPPIIIMECADSLCRKFDYSIYDVLSYLGEFWLYF
jgi:FkbM family methyltransferase